MDPQKLWTELSRAFEDLDWEAAEDAATALAAWLDRDGPPPTITGQAKFDKMLARGACWRVLSGEF